MNRLSLYSLVVVTLAFATRASATDYFAKAYDLSDRRLFQVNFEAGVRRPHSRSGISSRLALPARPQRKPGSVRRFILQWSCKLGV